MSDAPYGNMPAGPNPWTPPGALRSPGPSRAPLIIAILVALISLAVAIAAWFRPTHNETPTAAQYSEQQTIDSKKNLCDAYDSMYAALKKAGSASSDNPDQKFMIVLNVRMGFNTAADYLLETVNQNPAASPEASAAMRNLAISYQKMVLAQIEEDDDKIQASFKGIDAADADVKKVCT